MNKLKKLITGVVLSALCITTAIAPTSAYASEANTTIDVSIAATLIDVTITPSITIPILNPNSLLYSIPLTKINFTNNSKAPVKITLTSFTLAEGSDFTLVAPEKYADWTKLTKAQSKDIAVVLDSQIGWKSASTQYYRTGTTDSFVGTLDPCGMASLKVYNIFTGHSYVDTASATFNATFTIELE